MAFAEPVTLEGGHVRLEPMTHARADAIAAELGRRGRRRRDVGIEGDDDPAPGGGGGLCRAGAQGARCAASRSRSSRSTARAARSLGSTRYMNIEAPHRRLEIGTTWIGKSFQRTAINTEAKYLMLRHAFEVLHCIAVDLRTHEKNIAVAHGDRAPRREARRHPAEPPDHAGRKPPQHRELLDRRYRMARGQGEARGAARAAIERGRAVATGRMFRKRCRAPRRSSSWPWPLAYIALGGISSALAYAPTDAGRSGSRAGWCSARCWRAGASAGARCSPARVGAAAFRSLLGDLPPRSTRSGYAAIEVLAALGGACRSSRGSRRSDAARQPARPRGARRRGARGVARRRAPGDRMECRGRPARRRDVPRVGARQLHRHAVRRAARHHVGAFSAPPLRRHDDARVRGGRGRVPCCSSRRCSSCSARAPIAHLGGLGGHGLDLCADRVHGAGRAAVGNARRDARGVRRGADRDREHRAGRGPFAGVEGFLGDPELEVEGYAAGDRAHRAPDRVLAAAQRKAMRARAIGRRGSRPPSARIGCSPTNGIRRAARSSVTGDSRALVGVPPARSRTLADWLALVVPDDRDRVGARFDELRARTAAPRDRSRYRVTAPRWRGRGALTDEARAIRDHDGELHRVAGIVRIASACMTEVACGTSATLPRAPVAAATAGRRLPDPRPRRHAVRPGLDAQAVEERRLRHAFADAARPRHEAGGPGGRHRRRLDRRRRRQVSRGARPASAAAPHGHVHGLAARGGARASASGTRRATSCCWRRPCYIDGWATPWYRGLRPLLYAVPGLGRG